MTPSEDAGTDTVEVPGTAGSDSARRYRRWATVEATGSSPTYVRLALACAGDPAVTELLDGEEQRCHQPNLLFGVLRLHGVDVADPPAALTWVGEHPDLVRAELRARRTQTNEVARCAVVVPALAELDGPLALVEVGASAGLNLLLDRWRYRWTRPSGDVVAGPADAPLEIRCAVTDDQPLPSRLPRVGWRCGLDLHPLDAADPDDRAWLRALVWPEHTDRAERLDAALSVAAAEPPPVLVGDLATDLPALLDRVPAGLTPVVLHSVVLTYVAPEQRSDMRALLRQRGVHRVGLEPPDTFPDLRAEPPHGVDARDAQLLTLDDRVLGFAQPHGRGLHRTSA